MSENLAKYNVILELIANTKGIDEVDKKVGGLQKTFNIAKTAFAGIVAGVAIQSIGQQIFETTAKFQGYESVLKNTLGTQQEADKALNLIKETAKGTVFSVDELTASYLKFANRGIKLTGAEITKLADIAASQGKSFDQLTEAVLDAQTGEFERLKEFGIRASKSGDQVSFTFKGVTQTIKNTPEAINELITSYGDLQGVQGANISQMETLNGRMSNIRDTVDELFVKIGKSLLPVFNFLLDIVVSIISALGTFANILISIPKFVSENATAFKALGVAIFSFNIPLVISTTALLSNIVATKAKAAADFFLATRTGLLTRAQWLLNAAFAANPIGIIVGSVALLVAGFVLLYNKSESVRNVFSGIANIAKSLVNIFKDVSDSITKTFSGGFLDGIKNIGTSIIDGIKKSFSDAFSDLENIVKGEDVAASALRLAKKVLNLMTFGLSGALTEAGKFVIDSFTKGFDENKEFEAKVKVKLNRGSFGGNYQKGIDDAKKAREKITADEKKLDEERQKRAEARQKKQDELDKLNEAARKKKYDSEIEAVEKTYALQEQEALKTIKDADELALKLKQIETQKQIDLTKIKIKYSKNGTSDAIKLENELIELEAKYKEFFQRAKVDPLDLLPTKLKDEITNNVEQINRKIKELEIQYNSTFGEESSGLQRIDIAEKIKSLRKDFESEVSKLNSHELNKLTFESKGTSIINIEDLLPEDQVSAIKNRLSVIDDVIANFKPKNVTELNVFNQLKSEAEKLKKYLDELGLSDSKEGFIQNLFGLSDENFAKFQQDMESAFNLAKDSLNNILDNEIEATDKRIELQQDRVNAAEKIAEKGNVKQLELEEERLSKLQEKREKFVAAQRILSQLEILQSNAVAAAKSIEAISAAFAAGGPAGIITGIATSIALTAQIAAIVSTVRNSFGDLPAFFEGSELISADHRFRYNKVTNGRDGYIFRGDGTERIVDGFTNSKLNGFPNSLLPDAVKLYQMQSTSIPKIVSIGGKIDKELAAKMDRMIESFENSRTYINLDKKGLAIQIDKMIQQRLQRKRYTA